MALQATLESLDDLPEVLHEHYEQDGDVYRLRVDGYEDTALRNSLDYARKDVKRLRKQLEGYEGISPEEVAELREKRDEYESKIAQAGSWEEQKERLEAQHKRDLERVKGEVEQERLSHHQYRKRNAVLAALNEANAIPEALDDKVIQRTRIEVDEHGEFQVVATGLDDNETDLPSLIQQMKEANGKYDWGFRPNGNSGSGAATGTGGGTAGKVRTKKDLKSAAEHSRYIAEHGLPAYQELPRE